MNASKEMSRIFEMPFPNSWSETSETLCTHVLFLMEAIKKDTNQLAVAIAVFAVLLTTLVLWVWSKKGNLLKLHRNAILILGPSDSGKTLLFCQLLRQNTYETFTSMKENEGKYSIFKKDKNHNSKEEMTVKKMVICDIPGNDRIRYSALEKRKEKAKAIIYVIDSSTIKQKLRDSAEYLFNVLREPCLHRAGVPVLVVINKQDLFYKAKGSEPIKKELEKEINILRETKSKMLPVSSGNPPKESEIYLGKKGKDFEFSDLTNEIKFLEASAKDPTWLKDNCKQESGVFGIRRWIALNA